MGQKKKGNKNHVGSHITRRPVPLLTTTGDVVSLSISADCIAAPYLCLNIDTRRQEAVFGLSCGSSTRKKTPLHVTRTDGSERKSTGQTVRKSSTHVPLDFFASVS